MAFGLQIFDASGALIWDSTTALGCVVGDFRKYASGASGETVSYPQWPTSSFTPMLIDCGGSGEFVSMDISAGYPVVTVTSPTNPMAYGLVVY